MNQLSIKLVRNTDKAFWSGRQLARDVYANVWGTATDALTNDYDFAVLVCDGDEVKGNLNIKKRVADTLLPSEKFFRPKHWERQCQKVETNQIAELCSLAVCAQLSNKQRIKVFNALILGSHMLAMHIGILAYATVQRSELINTLIRLMKYPFFPSDHQQLNAANLPLDNYWQTEPKPQLFYVVHGPTTDSASFRLLNSLLQDGFVLQGFNPHAHSTTLASPQLASMVGA